MFDYEILDLGLVHYKKVLKEPQEIIKKIYELDEKIKSNPGVTTEATSEWTPWTYGDNVFCTIKNLKLIENIKEEDFFAKEMKEISSSIFESLDAAFEHYSNTLYPFAGRVIKLREPRFHILRYESAGFLPAHQDQGISSRILSSVTYFNDDYEGGEIEFVHSNVKIKPGAGDIIFFPSNYLGVHEIHKMISGVRYASPNWWHSMNPLINSDGSE